MKLTVIEALFPELSNPCKTLLIPTATPQWVLPFHNLEKPKGHYLHLPMKQQEAPRLTKASKSRSQQATSFPGSQAVWHQTEFSDSAGLPPWGTAP